jgi:hypothetical protein
MAGRSSGEPARTVPLSPDSPALNISDVQQETTFGDGRHEAAFLVDALNAI